MASTAAVSARKLILRMRSDGQFVNHPSSIIAAVARKDARRAYASSAAAAAVSGSCPVTTKTLVSAGATCPMASKASSTSAAAIGEPSTDGGQAAESSVTSVKSMHELDGPPAWPIVGNFLTYLKKENRGQMHVVQVGRSRIHFQYTICELCLGVLY